MSLALSQSLGKVLSRQSASSGLLGKNVRSPWFAPVMTLKTSAPLCAEPKKKKRVDPRRELIMKERLRKKLKKLEKVPPELIPIEDFITSTKCLDEARTRSAVKLSFEESEGRALLLKEWCRYKQEQHVAEVRAIESALEAQRVALAELRIMSEELYQAALKPDPLLFPFTHKGPVHTPPQAKYKAPEGKYNDITRVYTQ